MCTANRAGSFSCCGFGDASSTIATTIITICAVTRIPTTFASTPRIIFTIIIFACTVVIIIYTTIIAS